MDSIHLLLADPDINFHKKFAGLFGKPGYLVKYASTIDELQTCLHESWYHLAIVNVQMENTENPQDTTGIDILQEHIFQHLPKIIISNHPNVELTRKVLRPGPAGFPLAVDFLGKDSDLESIKTGILDTIEKHVRVNGVLNIQQKGNTSILQIAQLVFPELPYVLLIERIGELENLLRCYFYQSQQITLSRLLHFHPGYTAIEILDPSYETETLLMTCSEALMEESTNSVPQNIDRLIYRGKLSSIHFSIRVYGIHYSPPLSTFSEVYRNRNTDELEDVIGKITTNHFTDLHNMQLKYESPEGFIQCALERLNIDFNRLESCIGGICQSALTNGIAQISADQHTIHIQIDEQQPKVFPNPIFLLKGNSLENLPGKISCGLTHGFLTGTTILIDADNQNYFIDCEMLAIGPIVQDYNALEMVIRLEGMEGIKFNQRFYLEQNLLGHNSENIPQELVKPLYCINLIRQMSNVNKAVYSRGLLVTTLRTLLEFRPGINYTSEELVNFSHALLLASILFDQMVKKKDIPQQARESLWINQDSMEVWVEGNLIDLTPQDLEILLYLYKNAGQQRSRQQIIDSVFLPEADNQDMSQKNSQGEKLAIEESRLNSAMSRLRQKIELDPENPKYLHTIRGIGYRLDV